MEWVDNVLSSPLLAVCPTCRKGSIESHYYSPGAEWADMWGRMGGVTITYSCGTKMKVHTGRTSANGGLRHRFGGGLLPPDPTPRAQEGDLQFFEACPPLPHPDRSVFYQRDADGLGYSPVQRSGEPMPLVAAEPQKFW